MGYRRLLALTPLEKSSHVRHTTTNIAVYTYRPRRCTLAILYEAMLADSMSIEQVQTPIAQRQAMAYL